VEETALALFDGRLQQRDSLRSAPFGKGIHHCDLGIWSFWQIQSAPSPGRPIRPGWPRDDRLGGHAGGVGGQRDDRTGRSGHGTAWGHVDHHRHGAGTHGFGHGIRRQDITAGGVKLQDNYFHFSNSAVWMPRVRYSCVAWVMAPSIVRTRATGPEAVA